MNQVAAEEAGDPDLIVAVDGNSPGAPRATARVEWRPRRRRAVGPQHRDVPDAAVRPAELDQVATDIGVSRLFGQLQLEQLQLRSEIQTGAGRVGDPRVSLAVDCHSLAAVPARL